MGLGGIGVTASLTLACIWAFVASAAALTPRRQHRHAAVGMIATSIPLLGWVTFQNGPLWGLLALALGSALLSWPVVHLLRRLRRGVPGQEPAE